MIIRSNLASAPIKNYSLFLLGCILLAVVVVLFTVWNVASLGSSYSRTTELKNSISTQQRQITDLENKAKILNSGIQRIKTPGFVAETEFMNNAIKRRTFSWTALFDHFEQVLPPTVKMISISLQMSGQTLADMLELVRLLERDPIFAQVVLRGERTGEVNDEILFSISLKYIPTEAPASSAASTSPAEAKQMAGGIQ